MSGLVGHAERAAILGRVALVFPPEESDRAVARRLGCANSNVSRWIAGKALPDAASLLAIRREYGVSVDWLLTGTGPRLVADHTPTEDGR